MTYSTKLDGWAAALEDVGKINLGRKLRNDTRNREEALCCLEDAGLPTYDREVVGLREFSEKSREVLSRIPREQYYVTLLPHQNHLQRYSKSGLAPQEVLSFVSKSVDLERVLDDYDLVIQEFEKNAYGGTIVSDGTNVVLEMAEGKQSQIARGTADKLLQAEKREHGFKYSTDEPHIRKLMWSVLKQLRTDNQETVHGAEFLKGYFEFALTESPKQEGLRLVFFDYQTGESYLKLI